MFEAAVTKFAKSIGEQVVLPAPSVDENNYCEPLQLVVKKNRRWRWQSAEYQPTPFNMSQIFLEAEKVDLEPSTKQVVVYNKIHKLSVNGKLGAKIKVLLDVELDGSDSVDVEAKFGDVNKCSIDETKLMKILSAKHLNTSHDFIKQVRDHPRKVLCVVTSSYQLASPGTISAQKEISADEKLGDEKIGKALVDANEDFAVDDKNDNSMIVAANTVVAYKVCELLIKPDKSFQLIIDKDSSGGFTKDDEVDGASGSMDMAQVEENSVENMFKSLMSMEISQKDVLVKAILQICKYPKDVDTFLVLTKKALALATETSSIGISKDTHLALLKEKFLCPDQDWAPLLQMTGFSFIADGTVVYPKACCVILEPVVNVFKSLIELDDDQLLAFSGVTPAFARPLIYLLSQTIRGKTVKTDDEDLSPLYNNSNPGQILIQSLGFQVNHQGEILATTTNENELQGASRALFGLYWKKEYEEHTSSWCHIL